MSVFCANAYGQLYSMCDYFNDNHLSNYCLNRDQVIRELQDLVTNYEVEIGRFKEKVLFASSHLNLAL